MVIMVCINGYLLMKTKLDASNNKVKRNTILQQINTQRNS